MTSNAPSADESAAGTPGRRKPALWQRLLPWLITVVCFGYLYTRIDRAAGPETSVPAYLARVFAEVDWGLWLLLMVPYSALFMLIDTAVLWRVVNWFNARVSYAGLLPVRASTYIISILNEQVGKGAIALFLNRREGVPGWQVISSMLFIMFCEFFYLALWALIGCIVGWDVLPPLFHAIPVVAVGAFLFFVGFVYFMRSERFAGNAFRERDLFHSFRRADLSKYGVVVLLRSPALLAAVAVYDQAARLFGVEIGFLNMLGILPVIFFGTFIPGPFRAVAVTMWPTLFPDNAAQMAAFGFVQHNFFVLFNAAIGLIFLRRANRYLFDEEVATSTARA